MNQDKQPQDIPQDTETTSKTEELYGKQASGIADLDKKNNISPLTNREDTGTAGEKPDTNPQNKEEGRAKTTFMSAVPPDEKDPEVKKLNEQNKKLRDEAAKNQSVMPKMGDNAENRTDDPRVKSDGKVVQPK